MKNRMYPRRAKQPGWKRTGIGVSINWSPVPAPFTVWDGLCVENGYDDEPAIHFEQWTAIALFGRIRITISEYISKESEVE